jgi:hypothetical protein
MEEPACREKCDSKRILLRHPNASRRHRQFQISKSDLLPRPDIETPVMYFHAAVKEKLAQRLASLLYL